MRDSANLFFLFRQLLGRELTARYRSTFLGMLWIILQPLLMLLIYTLVFGGIFKARWPGTTTSSGFALMLFAGLIVFNFFSEVLVSSPSLVSSQPNYVKKVVFPVEVLAVVRVAAAGVTALLSLLILLVAEYFVMGSVAPSFLLAPVVLIAMLPMLLGMGWLLSALGVYLQDISQFSGLLASMLLFLSPIFFPSSAMPKEVGFLVNINPLVTPIEQLRAVVMGSSALDPMLLMKFVVLSSLFAGASLLLFRRLSRGFPDVL